jgi:hypothetical protein
MTTQPLSEDDLQRAQDLADDNIATVRDLRLLLSEVKRLRVEYASLSKVYKIINDAHEYKSIKVYELTDLVDAMEPKLKAVTEFVTSEPEQTGHCGSMGHTSWCHRHAHMEAREQVSRALGLDQSEEA